MVVVGDANSSYAVTARGILSRFISSYVYCGQIPTYLPTYPAPAKLYTMYVYVDEALSKLLVTTRYPRYISGSRFSRLASLEGIGASSDRRLSHFVEKKSARVVLGGSLISGGWYQKTWRSSGKRNEVTPMKEGKGILHS